jgi:uncharacterized C2H2 Zn-finger protein
MNDMTSMDCPVCKKSFKLTRAEDPNEAWDRHFSTDCSQQPGAEKAAPMKCASPNCSVTLGPSNRFECPRCQKLVCLACRTVEVHQCVAVPVSGATKGPNDVTAARLSKLSGTSSSRSNATTTKKSKTTGNKIASKSKPKGARGGGISDISNTLKGSSQRRMAEKHHGVLSTSNHHSQPIGVASPPGNIVASEGAFDCPLCSQRYHTSVELIQHVEVSHNSTQTPPQSRNLPLATSSGIGSSTTSRVETPDEWQCPTCSQRFHDVMTLIQHAETAHPALGEGGSSNSGASNEGSNCQLS